MLEAASRATFGGLGGKSHAGMEPIPPTGGGGVAQGVDNSSTAVLMDDPNAWQTNNPY